MGNSAREESELAKRRVIRATTNGILVKGKRLGVNVPRFFPWSNVISPSNKLSPSCRAATSLRPNATVLSRNFRPFRSDKFLFRNARANFHFAIVFFPGGSFLFRQRPVERNVAPFQPRSDRTANRFSSRSFPLFSRAEKHARSSARGELSTPAIVSSLLSGYFQLFINAANR